MTTGIIFLLAVLGGVLCFAIGWKVGKDSMKPTYLPNSNIPHNGGEPHTHAHDFGPDGKFIKV